MVLNQVNLRARLKTCCCSPFARHDPSALTSLQKERARGKLRGGLVGWLVLRL